MHWTPGDLSCMMSSDQDFTLSRHCRLKAYPDSCRMLRGVPNESVSLILMVGETS